MTMDMDSMANPSSGEPVLCSEPFPHPLHLSNIFDVEGLVVVVTGGGTGGSFVFSKATLAYFLGIGLMMAKALENNGATVYIIGRRMGVLEKAALDHNVRQLSPFTPLLQRSRVYWYILFVPVTLLGIYQINLTQLFPFRNLIRLFPSRGISRIVKDCYPSSKLSQQGMALSTYLSIMPVSRETSFPIPYPPLI